MGRKKIRRPLKIIGTLLFAICITACEESKEIANEPSSLTMIELLADSLNINNTIVKVRSLESDMNLKNHMVKLFIKELDSVGDESSQREIIEKLVSKELVSSKKLLSIGSSVKNDTIEINLSEKIYNDKGNYACVYFAKFQKEGSSGYIVFFKKNEKDSWDLYFIREIFN